MTNIHTILRDPLLHFLAAGLLLFGLFNVLSPDEADQRDDLILVDRAALLTFMQYRMRAFDPELASARLDGLSDRERERLIADYVREEALHREALALGMDSEDYIIKRRLIQKVEFLAQGIAESSASPDEQALRAYFEANMEDYFIKPTVTFTHVFFDAEHRGAEAAAAAKLEELNAEGVPFAQAPRHGDRFPYHLNYVEREHDFVASHFGPEMAAALFALPGGDGIWRGPYRSPYGTHLVLIAKAQPGRTPDLAEVRARVAYDAARLKAREVTDAAIEKIVETYEVRVAEDLRAGMDAARAQAAATKTAPAGQ